jgi:hypothetical protein
MLGMRTEVCVAEKMGEDMGCGEILLGCLPFRPARGGGGRGSGGGKVNAGWRLIKRRTCRIAARPRPVRLEAQDTALSRRRQGFESPTGRQFRINL